MGKSGVASALRGLARLAGVALLLFGLLEASARVALFGPKGLDPRRYGLLYDLDPGSLVHYDTEPGLVYEYRPNLDVFFKGAHLRTNSLGMADVEFALVKPPGMLRVAVIGSSFELPLGVEPEDAWHAVLERRCAAARAPNGCEFLNFAVGMHGPSQFLVMLEKRALPLAPDLVIVALTPLAAPRMFASHRDTPPRDVLRLVAPRPRSFLVKLARLRLGLDGSPGGAYAIRAPAPVPEAEQVVTRLGAFSREHGLPLIVLRTEVDARPASPLEEALEARVRAEGMDYVDTRRAFAGEPPERFWIHALDPHPNAEAHARFAAVLEEHLRAAGWLSGSRTRTERSAGRP